MLMSAERKCTSCLKCASSGSSSDFYIFGYSLVKVFSKGMNDERYD